MKYDFFGNNENGWGCSIKYEKGIDTKLAPCPFCGSSEITIHNTHTPTYWAQCECSAQIDCEEQDDEGLMTKLECKSVHEKGFNSAIKEWNSRV